MISFGVQLVHSTVFWRPLVCGRVELHTLFLFLIDFYGLNIGQPGP